MPSFACTVLPPYPRSDRVRRLLRRMEELGEAGLIETGRAILEDSLMLLGVQLAAGVDAAADPLIDWHDLLRPFAEAWRGVWIDGLNRWFDNNFFYRIPVVEELPDPQRLVTPPRVKAVRSILPEWADVRVTLPGPVTFTRLAKIREGLDEVKVAERIAEILALEAEKSVANGAKIVDIHEPFLGDIDARPEDGELAARLASMIASKVGGRAIVRLLTYYAPPRPEVWEKLSEAKVDTLMIDYVDAPAKAEKALEKWAPKKLIVGLVNARSIYPEDPRKVADEAKRLAYRYNVEEFIVATSAPVDLIPLRYAIEKTRIACEAARLASI